MRGIGLAAVLASGAACGTGTAAAPDAVAAAAPDASRLAKVHGDSSPSDAAAGMDATLRDGEPSDLDDAATDATEVTPGAMGSPAPPPVPTGCVTDVSAGHRVVSCQGITHNLTVPEICLTRTCGLIFDIHGGTMSGDMEDKSTQLAEIAPSQGFIVVQPNATDGLWSAKVDDPLVYSFLTNVRDAFHVDPHHIHMTGISQGGYMTWRFLCAHTDLFGSVAPVAAAGEPNIDVETGCTFTGTDVPSGEVDILYMHGTLDALVNFSNAITLRDAVIAFYKMDADAGTIAAGDGTFTRTSYKTASGRVFEFLQHNYISSSMFLGVAIKGHCFPGSMDQSVTLPDQLMSFGCNPPNSFVWGQEALAFFVAHPKP